MKQIVALALLLSFCTYLPAMGQTTPAGDQDDVVKITTNLVQIDAVVTKDGKPVTDLKAEDFEIYEDGRRQTITSFAYISNVPDRSSSTPDKTGAAVPAGRIKRDVARRTIAIVVDDLGISAESMAHARRQVRKFINEQMQPDDLVAVIRTGGQLGALQQFTNDKRVLIRAVDQLRWNPCSRVGMSVFRPIGGLSMPIDRPLCGDFTLRALNFILDGMAELPGRKSMILMSDDLPRQNQEINFSGDPLSAGLIGGGSSERALISEAGANITDYTGMLQRIAEKAIRSSVVIYSVDTQGLQPVGVTAADAIRGDARSTAAQMNNVLSQRSRLLEARRAGGDLIARQTGGFQIRNSNDFGLPRILEDQSGYYLLGYRPTEETFNRRFHHIKAKVKRSGMTVRTRFGFFGVSEEEVKRARSPQDETNLALMSPFGVQDLELDLVSFFANGKTEGSVVRSFVYFNTSDLTFTPVNDRRETSLEIHGMIFGNNGRIVEQVKHDAVLRLKDDEYQNAMREGLRLRFDMPVKQPGSYQVRLAVRDKTSSKIGSAGQFVAVPDLKSKRLALSGIVLRGAPEGSAQTAALANPASRRFNPNSELYFAFVIYNAMIDPATRLPNLTMETKLFRDGKSVGSSVETAVNVANQADLERLFTSGFVKLGPDLEPGEYYLQVVVTDKAAKGKQPPVTQWVDFEIVK